MTTPDLASLPGTARDKPAARAERTSRGRLDRYRWDAVAADLNDHGFGVLERLLDPQECERVAALYDQSDRFRSRVHMARHGFGRGEYRYFRYPLPRLVHTLRAALYRRLVGTANAWTRRLGMSTRYPATHREFLDLCRSAGQARPTPLLLHYTADDYNCLHQDLYGELAFPLQVVMLLSSPGEDFTGGEFVLSEQRPRMQSRAEVVPLGQGDACVFAVHHRPVQGARGPYRVNLRHGISRVRSGRRRALGIIFHDAK